MIGLRSAAVVAGLLLSGAGPGGWQDLCAIARSVQLSGRAAEDFLSSWCGQCGLVQLRGYEVSEEEWSLLTDSADILAQSSSSLTSTTMTANSISHAFESLDDPDTCASKGPKVEPMMDELVNLGGSRDALPDQDAAYEAFSAREASWERLPPARRKRPRPNEHRRRRSWSRWWRCSTFISWCSRCSCGPGSGRARLSGPPRNLRRQTQDCWRPIRGSITGSWRPG